MHATIAPLARIVAEELSAKSRRISACHSINYSPLIWLAVLGPFKAS